MRDDRNHADDDGLGDFVGLVLRILLITVLNYFATNTVEDDRRKISARRYTGRRSA